MKRFFLDLFVSNTNTFQTKTEAWSAKMSSRWRRSENLGHSHRTLHFTSALSLPLTKCLFLESQMRLICSQIIPSVLCTLACSIEDFKQNWDQDSLSGLKGSMAPGSEATSVSAVLRQSLTTEEAGGKVIFNCICVSLHGLRVVADEPRGKWAAHMHGWSYLKLTELLCARMHTQVALEPTKW